MDQQIAAKLRAPFPDEAIGHRPQPTCKACSDAQYKVCDKHRKQECPTCGQYMTIAHIHLDYVGHADATDRLLEVDPAWTWEPVAWDQRGLPALDDNGGLWLRLTVAGVTRLGYGDAGGKRGPNAIKEAIGDGIRNAAMRFGVALDLWMKGDRAASRHGIEADPGRPAASGSESADAVREQIRSLAEGQGWNLHTVAQGYAQQYPGRTLRGESDVEPLRLFLADLQADAAREAQTRGAA